MGFLIGSTTRMATEANRLSGITLQSSAYGLAIPIVYGRTRITANLIWYGDFTAIPHTTTQSSGGKGGGGVTQTSTTYTYTTGVAFGLCEGPGISIGNLWSGKELTTVSDQGFTIFSGTYPQSPWGYLTTKHADQALTYQGLSYAANGALDLGESASMPNFSFEVKARLPWNAGTVDDASPKDVVSDFLTNANYGSGFPAALLADWSSFANYCVAMGLFISPAFTEQAQAQEHLKDVMLAANSEFVWSEAVLKVVPYGDTQVTGNGVTWTPSITPVYDLTDDDFLDQGSSDPVIGTRKTTADAYNQVQIEYLNRANSYNVEIVEVKDQSNIEQYGLRPMSPLKLHMICDQATATKVAQIVLQRSLYIRNTYQFKLGWRYCLLEPMDIVTITDARLGLLLEQVRIVEIEEDENGALLVTAEEFPFGVAHPARVVTQAPGGYTVDMNVAPGNANAPVIFEPPISLAGSPQVWLASSGGASWGGAEIWVSNDNATYKRIGNLAGGARHGVLSAALATGADPDVTNTLSVDLTTSRGQLIGGTSADRDSFATLCYVGGELVSFQNSTLTASYRYNLTSLRRGAYGTPVAAHALGAPFVRLDQAIYRLDYDPAQVGKTIYVKLRSYNIYGGAIQDLADITPTTYTITGAPVGGIGGLFPEQAFTGRSAKIAWPAMAGAIGYRVQVWAAGVMKRSTDTNDTRFEYSFEDAKADGGPWRTLDFKVYAITETGVSATAAVLELTNPQIAAPTAVTSLGVLEGFTISCAKPADTDYAGCRVWASTTSGFDPGSVAPVYDGVDTSFSYYGLTAGTDYYLRIGCYDVFGTDGMSLSSELHVTIRGITSDPSATLAAINTILSGASDTDKMVFSTGAFAIASLSGDKYPFAVVDTGGGVYKVLLNSDVLIGGNVDIANLTTGSLPSNVIMRLGGGTVELDGAGEIRVYAGLGANQDFVSLTSGAIVFRMYVSGVGYVPYNYLTRTEQGVANNGDTVVIPGYWKTQPKVIVSPNSIKHFVTAYANQDQTINCGYANLVETSAGSKRWQFQAVAMLNLGANTGTSALNATSGDSSSNSWTSSSYTTAANCVSISPTVSVKSQRGNGSSQYYYRTTQWRVEYYNGSTWVPDSTWRSVNLPADTTSAVQDNYTFTFPSSGTWQWRIAFQQGDTNGTVFGAISYTYTQETVTQSGANANVYLDGGGATYPSQHDLTATASISLASPVQSGEIYEIDYSWNTTVTMQGEDSGSSDYFGNTRGVGQGTEVLYSHQTGANNFSAFRTSSVSPSGYTKATNTPSNGRHQLTWSKSCTAVVSGSSLSLASITASMCAVGYAGSGSEVFNIRTQLSGGSAVVKHRTPVSNSTTPVNNSTIVSYGYSLSAAQVLASGTLNWLAVG